METQIACREERGPSYHLGTMPFLTLKRDELCVIIGHHSGSVLSGLYEGSPHRAWFCVFLLVYLGVSLASIRVSLKIRRASILESEGSRDVSPD